MTLRVTVKPSLNSWVLFQVPIKAFCSIGILAPQVSGISISIFIIMSLMVFSFGTTAAQASRGNVCDRAARHAATETGVPLSVLWAITRTETGRSKDGQLLPWPWTVNMEGAGKWFETEDAARAYVFKHFKRGARSFDVGCFQINYKWHGTAFRSIDQMFDPLENARYAASFLRRLYRETGDWSVAAGAYHSRTPEYASRYRARFDRIRQRHKEQPGEIMLAADRSSDRVEANLVQPRQNNYPLLRRAGAKRSFGSLVPLAQKPARSLFLLTNASEGS